MAFEEELPEAPEPHEGETAPISGIIDSSLFEGVSKVGDTIPRGTYDMRLDSYQEQWFDRTDANGNPIQDNNGATIKDPTYNARWVVQQEPLIGRSVFDPIQWVRDEDIAAALSGDPSAKALINRRLIKANSIMYAAGFKPNGKLNFKDFLDSHPEVKNVIGEKEKVTRKDGKWVPTGEMKNVINKYMSLHKPT